MTLGNETLGNETLGNEKMRRDAQDKAALAKRYAEDGYLGPIAVLDAAEAATHRRRMEWAEEQLGPLHYKAKVHTILGSPLALATHPLVLDIVEALIGPNLLLYDVQYIVKEPQSRSHVSWHQDLTYWGLSADDQVSLWLALSPATAESGCMLMVPGSHKQGMQEQMATDDPDNVLLQGQTLRQVDSAAAVPCPLQPGEASFHHGWTVHASMPNRSSDRRIGLNAQFVAPHVRQTKVPRFSALLVRGEDPYGHYEPERLAEEDLAPAALARQDELQKLYRSVAGSA